ncbi:hypothetical protein PG997_006425 [Apiospora hydei]|uniref:Uncharacterized protein n=1 Tax=Apiospora hydei TaxID=1337664 RepID=A0ABR1WNS2_9PEZI
MGLFTSFCTRSRATLYTLTYRAVQLETCLLRRIPGLKADTTFRIFSPEALLLPESETVHTLAVLLFTSLVFMSLVDMILADSLLQLLWSSIRMWVFAAAGNSTFTQAERQYQEVLRSGLSWRTGVQVALLFGLTTLKCILFLVLDVLGTKSGMDAVMCSMGSI